MRGAAARLAPEGVLIVATRSAAAIRREAARNGWRAWGDGFVSHERRGTFQHGMDAEEIVGLGEMLGLRPQRPLPTVRDTSLVALSRRTPTTGPCNRERRPRPVETPRSQPSEQLRLLGLELGVRQHPGLPQFAELPELLQHVGVRRRACPALRRSAPAAAAAARPSGRRRERPRRGGTRRRRTRGRWRRTRPGRPSGPRSRPWRSRPAPPVWPAGRAPPGGRAAGLRTG